MKDAQAFIADLRTWDDFTLISAAVLAGVVTRRSPDAKAVDRAMKAELRRRRLGGQVERLIAAAKIEGERMLAETTAAHLPDGSAILKMPGGATATVRYAERETPSQE